MVVDEIIENRKDLTDFKRQNTRAINAGVGAFKFKGRTLSVVYAEIKIDIATKRLNDVTEL